MNRYESLEVPFASLSVISGTTSPNKTSLIALPERNGNITISQAIDAYMACYQGKDESRAQRMTWWQSKIGSLTLNEVDEDHIFFAIEELANKDARYYAGKDADGKAIFKSKSKPYAPATINRYAAAIGALDTTLTVTSGTETLFPSPTAGDYFYVTLEDSTKTVREIVKCTSRTGVTLTVVRAQDGTLGNIFALGSTVEMRVNKAAITDTIAAAISAAAAAATSASNAATSATAAAGSATAAAATYVSFDKRYLGSKSSAPSVDNQGAALLTGALYWDTSTNALNVYTGSAWTPYGNSGDPAGTAVAMAIALG